MIQRRSGTLRLEVISRFSLHFREFELIAEGQKHKKMMCSYKDNYFSERLTFEICPLQLMMTLNFEASRARRPQHIINDVWVWWTPFNNFVLCLHSAIRDAPWLTHMMSRKGWKITNEPPKLG